MKKKFKFLVSTLLVLIAMYSCEKYETEPVPDSGELKRANNGMIKSYDNTMVLKWNEALSTAIDKKMPPPAESRIYAMVSLAVHDALNNVVPKYETYALDNSWNDGKEVSKKTIYSVADAAVAQSAHDVLTALYPNSIPNVDPLLESCLSAIEDSELKDEGIQIGKDAAAAVLAKRQNDILPAFVPYAQGTEPGQYRSTPPFDAAGTAYAPYWGQTTPFGIVSGDQFRPGPPYAIKSPEYTADYNEVKSLGSDASTTRTQEQTDMSVFVTDNMPCMLNKVARVVAIQQELNGWETAHLFALTQMAEADAIICSFDGLYYYNFWRPLIAIHDGDIDGNDDTEGEPGWIPLQKAKITPAIPSYPDPYAVAGTAGAEILKMFFGTDNISYSITSYNLPGVERSYNSFSKLAAEMSVSRIYVGHNFRNDNTAGEQMGPEIAKYIYKNNLREIK